MNWMERNIVDRKDHRLIFGSRGRVFSVTLEREVVPWWRVRAREVNNSEKHIRCVLLIDISTLSNQTFCSG